MDLANDKDYLIEVSVGSYDKSETFFINAALLPLSCKYLSSQLSSPDSDVRRIDLPDENPGVFDLYREWIHCPRDPLTYCPEKECEDAWISNAAAAWLLGKRLEDGSFQKYALAQFIQTCALAPFGPWNYVEMYAPPKSPLARFSNHYVAWNLFFIGTGTNEFVGLNATKLVPLVEKTTHDPRVYDIEHWYSDCGDNFSAGCNHDPIARKIQRFRENNAPKEDVPAPSPFITALERIVESSRSTDSSKSAKSSTSPQNPLLKPSSSSLSQSFANAQPIVTLPRSSLQPPARSSSPPNGPRKTASTSNLLNRPRPKGVVRPPRRLPPMFESSLADQVANEKPPSSSISQNTELPPPYAPLLPSRSSKPTPASKVPEHLRHSSSNTGIYGYSTASNLPIHPTSTAASSDSLPPAGIFQLGTSTSKPSTRPISTKRSTTRTPPSLPPRLLADSKSKDPGKESLSALLFRPSSSNLSPNISTAQSGIEAARPNRTARSAGGSNLESFLRPTSSNLSPNTSLAQSGTESARPSRRQSRRPNRTSPPPGLAADPNPEDPILGSLREIFSEQGYSNPSRNTSTAPSGTKTTRPSRTSHPIDGSDLESLFDATLLLSKPAGGARPVPSQPRAPASQVPLRPAGFGNQEPDEKVQCAQQ